MAWTDLLTVVVMILGGLTITVLGLYALAGDDGSLVDGLHTMVERNQATKDAWAEAVNVNTNNREMSARVLALRRIHASCQYDNEGREMLCTSRE